jgi:iron(III) transport system substrate-binding protein
MRRGNLRSRKEFRSTGILPVLCFPSPQRSALSTQHCFILRLGFLCIALLSSLLVSCDRSQKQVILYTSVDEPVARPIIQAFEQQTGIHVVMMTDTEATRTAGLAERLIAEKARPQSDVWWGNEIFHTINVAEADVFESYKCPASERVPPVYRDSKFRWAGTGLRVRVIAVSDSYAGKPISSIRDLADPALAGKIAMARPTAGTTGGHIAALYTLWGYDDADAFMRKLAANKIKLLGGNSVVAEAVGQGTTLAGLTDNDDVDEMIAQKGKLKMVIPDQGEGGIGTLAVPCTVALVKGGPNSAAGRKLVEYLLSPEVEQKLLAAKFARYSVFAKQGENAVRPMHVEFAAVAAQLKPAVERAVKILEGRE